MIDRLKPNDYVDLYKMFSDLKLEQIQQLSVIDSLEIPLKELLNNQLFISVITNLEVFLSEVLIEFVMSDEECMRSFVSGYKDFENDKFSLNEVFKYHDRMSEIVKKSLDEIIYHNLPKVKGIYENTFKITFPSITKMSKHISSRHDLVHREGRSKKKGKSTKVSVEMIIESISDSRDLINELCLKLKR